MNRTQALEAVRQTIGRNKVLWFGVRSTDAVSLVTYGLESLAYLSLISPLGQSDVEECCLESLTNRRVDLDDYLLDLDTSTEAKQLLGKIAAHQGKDFLLVPYGASKPVENEVRQAGGRFLGIDAGLAATLNNKFRVQQYLAERSLSVGPSWRFEGRDDPDFRAFLRSHASFVVRADYSGGGRNLWRLDSPEAFFRLFSQKPDLFKTCSFAPYIAESLPLNMEACVSRDGCCFVGALRLQLIGCEALTNRPFGYCGNDFSMSSFLEKEDILLCQAMMEQIGAWLYEQGYVGAFGVDALFQNGMLFFVELNPRLQGSTALSVRLAQEEGQIDILLAHMMAWLGIAFPFRREAYLESVLAQKPMAQIYLHNLLDVPVRPPCSCAAQDGWDMLPAPDVFVNPMGVYARLVAQGPVTRNGHVLFPEIVTKALAAK